MKAMILAAGFGTRLGEIGKTTPKCLMTAGGKTMLEHVVERLKQAGVTSLVINLHHLAEQVREFVASRNNFGVQVKFSPETEILGTGGGLKHAAENFMGEAAFFVHNADVYSELDLRTLAQTHNAGGAVATLAVMRRKTSRALLFDSAMQLCGWDSNEAAPEDRVRSSDRVAYAFSGVQILSPRIFESMQSESGQFSSIKAYINAVHAGQKVVGYDMSEAYWLDIGRPETLNELRQRIGA